MSVALSQKGLNLGIFWYFHIVSEIFSGHFLFGFKVYLKNNMNNLAELLAKYNQGIPQQQSKILRWQDEALEICKHLPDSYKFKGSIFKCCKLDIDTAKRAIIDCKELDKQFSLYFLKVFHSLRKKQEIKI
jgi:hypothetical protein